MTAEVSWGPRYRSSSLLPRCAGSGEFLPAISVAVCSPRPVGATGDLAQRRCRDALTRRVVGIARGRASLALGGAKTSGLIGFDLDRKTELNMPAEPVRCDQQANHDCKRQRSPGCGLRPQTSVDARGARAARRCEPYEQWLGFPSCSVRDQTVVEAPAPRRQRRPVASKLGKHVSEVQLDGSRTRVRFPAAPPGHALVGSTRPTLRENRTMPGRTPGRPGDVTGTVYQKNRGTDVARAASRSRLQTCAPRETEMAASRTPGNLSVAPPLLGVQQGAAALFGVNRG